MKQITLYIIIVLLIFVIGYLLQKGCNTQGPDHTQEHQTVDSILKLQQQKDTANKRYKDSIESVNAILKSDKDSLTAIIVSYEKNLSKQSNDIGGLLNELSNAEAQRDTALALNRCDSLARAVINAKATVGYYIFTNDSLRRVTDQIITAKTDIANRLNQQFTEANQSLFEVSLKYNNLFSDYQKINKKPKRFGIGPTLNVSIVDGKTAIVPGIGVTYSIIRF